MCAVVSREVVLVSIGLTDSVDVSSAGFVEVDIVLIRLRSDLNRLRGLVGQVLNNLAVLESAARQGGDEDGDAACCYDFVGEFSEVGGVLSE